MRSLLIVTMVALLAACAGSPEPAPEPAGDAAPAAADTASATQSEPQTNAQEEKPMSEYENKVAEIQTGKGTITVRFFPEAAPNHVRNFIDLSEQGFYDGTRFHRVIPGFMIQGGDPNTKTDNVGSWGTGGSGRNLKAEFNDIPHRRGVLSMARSGHPDSASSQFFIVVADSGFLDRQYTVFGEVLSGMEVADQIVNAPRGANDRPNDPVAIEDITIRDARPEEQQSQQTGR